jgi:hypothetical protein
VGARVGDRDRLGDCQSRWGPASFRHAACPCTSVTGPNFSHPERGEPLPKGFESCQGGRLNLLISCAGWQADPWVDRLPRLLEPMGDPIVRARTGATARRVIQSTPIHIAIVDLGLPLEHDASGPGVTRWTLKRAGRGCWRSSRASPAAADGGGEARADAPGRLPEQLRRRCGWARSRWWIARAASTDC